MKSRRQPKSLCSQAPSQNVCREGFDCLYSAREVTFGHDSEFCNRDASAVVQSLQRAVRFVASFNKCAPDLGFQVSK